MVIKKLIGNVIPRDGIKNIMSEAMECLDDLPSLQKKMEAFFLGAEMLFFLHGDNDVADFLAGRIVLSQSTLTRFLGRILERVQEVESISVIIREGYIICTLNVDKGPGGLEVSVKLGNPRVFLRPETPEIQIDILEFPKVRPAIPLAAFFYSVGLFILKKIAGMERIYRLVARNVPGLTVEGNTFKLNLMQVPGLEDVFSREILGLKLLDVFNIDRVELRNGEVQIYGGPRIPQKLIHRDNAGQ